EFWAAVLVLGSTVVASIPHTAVVGFGLAFVVVIHSPLKGCWPHIQI
ncbi:hypothetical protein A2U01_0093040, partial [Trifolium medium]|nr:hypothetical protein [Trifolium medium]